MSAKKNPRRKGQKKAGDHARRMWQAQVKAGLGYSDHDGGRRGSAKDVREAKTIRRRQRRRKEKLEESSF